MKTSKFKQNLDKNNIRTTVMQIDKNNRRKVIFDINFPSSSLPTLWHWITNKQLTRTSFSESPRHLLTIVDAEMLKNVVLHSVATALARRVLPVPIKHENYSSYQHFENNKWRKLQNNLMTTVHVLL